MVEPVGVELVQWAQASVGWALMAARAIAPATTVAVVDAPRRTDPPLRLRATITIDIEAYDPEEAARESEAIRGQFEMLRRAHPAAILGFQRRKPRSTPRPRAPTLVVAPYVDD